VTDEPPGEHARPAERLALFAALGEPTRRALYEYVAEHGGWVGREQAADVIGIGRTLAAHHLDRLAADGLVEVAYQPAGERRGPGAGRPAKVYRRASRQFELSLPPRQYELVALLLAEAVDGSRRDGIPLDHALEQSARRAGEAMATECRVELPRRAGRGQVRTAIAAELRSRGYEPVVVPSGAITLRNCPFHDLAQRHTELVCGLNLALLDGLLRGLPAARLTARLEPGDDRCCVKLDPSVAPPTS
jgi:predicted ArsR family transcriptional regulator